MFSFLSNRNARMGHRTKRKATAYTSKRWTNKEVPYYLANVFSELVENKNAWQMDALLTPAAKGWKQEIVKIHNFVVPWVVVMTTYGYQLRQSCRIDDLLFSVSTLSELARNGLKES